LKYLTNAKSKSKNYLLSPSLDYSEVDYGSRYLNRLVTSTKIRFRKGKRRRRGNKKKNGRFKEEDWGFVTTRGKLINI